MSLNRIPAAGAVDGHVKSPNRLAMLRRSGGSDDGAERPVAALCADAGGIVCVARLFGLALRTVSAFGPREFWASRTLALPHRGFLRSRVGRPLRSALHCAPTPKRKAPKRKAPRPSSVMLGGRTSRTCLLSSGPLVERGCADSTGASCALAEESDYSMRRLSSMSNCSNCWACS